MRPKKGHAPTQAGSDEENRSGGPSLHLHSWWSIIGLLVLSFGLQCVIFPPHATSWLAYICLTPWLVVVASSVQAPRVYWGSYLLGLASFLVNARWISLNTLEGYVAFTAYLAAYFPLMACPVRHAVRHWRLPMSVAAPVIWVGAELVRAWVISGFPWFYLSHTQYRVLSLIQVSDLVGAYGVSFLVAAVNGLFADLIMSQPWRTAGRGYRVPRGSIGFTLALLTLILGYGQFRLRQTTVSDGPRIAVLQRDFPLWVEERAEAPFEHEKAQAYYALIDRLRGEPIDLYLLPETPWSMCLNRECRELDSASRRYFEHFRRLALERNALVVVGAVFQQYTPLDLRLPERKHNSAYAFRPGGGEPERYDKVHCVYFGEVVPFRFGRFRFLYWWLNERSPWGAGDYEYSLTPGTEFKVFEIAPASQPRSTYRFGVPICYEDVMPYVARSFVADETGGKRVDFLLNISNDGWFQHSDELTQHLAICAFRAVENRVGIARAVNTGISGFIDPDGRVHDLVTVDGVSQGAGIEGARVANVRVDSRQSVYSRFGDVFAQGCMVLWMAFYVDYLRVRAIGRHRSETAMKAAP